MREWEKVMPEEDLKLYRKTHFGRRQEFGKKPAFLIIDVNRAFVGSTPRPILESVEEYRTSCGKFGWDNLQHIHRLQDACRASGVPVMFTTSSPLTRFAGSLTKKSMQKTEPPDPKGSEIHPSIAPLPDELVITKTRASGFFGTPLLQCLRNMGIDCLLVGGATTSGCVRATVVEACAHGFGVFVVEECVFDRFQLSHLVSLFDMNAKYADVITLEEALRFLKELAPEGARARV